MKEIKIIYKITISFKTMSSNFRKTSQSLYQPAHNKSTVSNSKFNGTLEGSALMGNKSYMPGSLRKIQGQDMLGSTKPNFQQKINKLKSKPNQKVLEDEYIKGLQQEIKYLQYELKLLKDKQIIEREGVNQLDNFLKDEIPINENILAMKNKYNATKNTLEEQFKLLSSKNIQAGDVLKTQKNQIERLHDIIEGHRKQMTSRGQQFKDKLNLVVRQLTLTEDQYNVLSQNNKSLQQKIKKMVQQTANIQRNLQKQKVLEVRAIEEKSKAFQKFEQKSKKTKQDMLQALQKVEQVEQHATDKGTNPLSDDLEQKNSTLRKKIMLSEKQKSTAQNIIAQIQLYLKQQERQREIERKQKLKITNTIDDVRIQLQNLQRSSDNMVKQQTLRTKKIMIKEMTHDLKEKQQIYDKLVERLGYLQQASSNLISDKKDLQDTIESEQSKEKMFLKKIKELEHEILQNKCSSQSLRRINKQLEQEIVPIKNDLEKCQGRIPLVEKEIEKKDILINHLNKQVQLLKELKGLDLDHLQMISTSGVHMQGKLNDFIKNWEKLKSL